MGRAHGRAVVQTSGWPSQTEGPKRNLQVREQTDPHSRSTTAAAALNEAPLRRRAESTRRGAGGLGFRHATSLNRGHSGEASRSAFAVLVALIVVDLGRGVKLGRFSPRASAKSPQPAQTPSAIDCHSTKGLRLAWSDRRGNASVARSLLGPCDEWLEDEGKKTAQKVRYFVLTNGFPVDSPLNSEESVGSISRGPLQSLLL